MSQENSNVPALKRTESKYKIGRVKSLPTVQIDEKTGDSYIELAPRSEGKIYGCTTFQGNYKEEEKLGQGTFGEVYKGLHLQTQRKVAMKRIIVNQENDLFPITAQREITILKRLNHKNIIKLLEMVYDFPPESNNKDYAQFNQNNSANPPAVPKKYFYMILPYMVADLSGILHNPRIELKMADIKNMMKQILEGVNFIHCSKFMHRDIKTANLLIDHNGVLKLADFGLARQYYGSPPNIKFPGSAGSGAKYTSVVVTRWYRAPELVLGDKYYTTAVDIWGVGCVFAEFFEKKPILQGKTDIDQGHVIFKLMGTPDERTWELAKYLPGAELTKTEYKSSIDERFGKHLTPTGLSFLKGLLALDPYKRLTAMSAMKHPFFQEEPLAADRLTLPCEESHEADIKRYKEELHEAMSQKGPSAPPGHIKEATPSPAKFEKKSGIKREQPYQSNQKNDQYPIKRQKFNQNPSVPHPQPKANRYGGSSLPSGPKYGRYEGNSHSGSLRNRITPSNMGTHSNPRAENMGSKPYQSESRYSSNEDRKNGYNRGYSSSVNSRYNNRAAFNETEDQSITTTTLNRYRHKGYHDNNQSQTRLQGHSSLPGKPISKYNSTQTNIPYRRTDIPNPNEYNASKLGSQDTKKNDYPKHSETQKQQNNEEKKIHSEQKDIADLY